MAMPSAYAADDRCSSCSCSSLGVRLGAVQEVSACASSAHYAHAPHGREAERRNALDTQI